MVERGRGGERSDWPGASGRCPSEMLLALPGPGSLTRHRHRLVTPSQPPLQQLPPPPLQPPPPPLQPPPQKTAEPREPWRKPPGAPPAPSSALLGAAGPKIPQGGGEGGAQASPAGEGQARPAGRSPWDCGSCCRASRCTWRCTSLRTLSCIWLFPEQGACLALSLGLSLSLLLLSVCPRKEEKLARNHQATLLILVVH